MVVKVCNLTKNGGMSLFLHILTSICCYMNFWSLPFWLVWGGTLGMLWFAFPWWLRMLNIFPGASQPFGIPQLRRTHVPLCS
jgi:hypothetical protein